LPLVQHALPMALELYHDEVLSLAQVVEKTAHAPAELFGIVDRGYLREGYWADLVLVDIDSRVRVERENVLYKCGWSPLEGEVLRSEVIATWVNGQPVYAHGRFSGAPEGMRLAFRR
ncbi:MAG TPA: dihydroorotase, partial [Chromatiaceae bacterium]|nr:dihydroorotase [Chromatiaceae bacterium]